MTKKLRVRIPILGQLTINTLSDMIVSSGDWRSGSAVDLHSIGRGFESLITHLGTVAESVDAPDLKSVGHYARESSSLSRPIK